MEDTAAEMVYPNVMPMSLWRLESCQLDNDYSNFAIRGARERKGIGKELGPMGAKNLPQKPNGN
jgi:hypothetical protein